jgi:hypothetical protein
MGPCAHQLQEAPWMSGRVSRDQSKTWSSQLTSRIHSQLTYTYNYDSRAGQGVDVYIIDTGIRVSHVRSIFIYHPLLALILMSHEKT